MKRKCVLITGVAGFIGSSFAHSLLTKGIRVVGIDNLMSNYPRQFKKENLTYLTHPRFEFYEIDILDKAKLVDIMKLFSPKTIIHLAAVTGVRASLTQPSLYRRINTEGTALLYRLAADLGINQFIFASSSSVYGKGNGRPFPETKHRRPRSPYAFSKRDAEDSLKILHQKYRLPATILRLFSVYGPRGRPDMAPYLFTEAAYTEKPITVFGKGDARRDFTNISDVITAIEKTLDKPFDFEIMNIGNTMPISVSKLIALTEGFTKKRLKKRFMPPIPQESMTTFADIRKANKLLIWHPQVKFTDGFYKFVKWYQRSRL